MKKLTSLFVIALLIFSCSKDTDSLKNEDDNNILVNKIVAIWTNGTVEVIDFTYDGNKLLKTEDLNGMVTNFSYDTKGLLTNIVKDIDSDVYINTVFNYNEDNKLISYTDFYNNKKENLGTDALAIRYDISDENNNTLLKVYNGNHNSQTNFIREEMLLYNSGNRIQENNEVSYFYDNKNGLFKNMHALKTLRLLDQASLNGIHINTSNNNVSDIKNMGNSDETITEYDYSYNSKDYPIRATYKENGELKADIEYFLSK